MAMDPGMAPREIGRGATEWEEKRALLRWLHRDVYVKLGVYSIEGVGVFAVRVIPRGQNPFTTCNDHLLRREKMITLSEREIEECAEGAGTKAISTLVKSFFAPLTEIVDETDGKGKGREVECRDEDGGLLFGVNATGTNTLDASWYLNHSEEPNVRFVECHVDDGFNSYEALREIAVGEELTVDYREMGGEYHHNATTPQQQQQQR